ncbi:MAG: DUF4380 domain-containing protein [Chloroflexi bacterium]|nr:DUF4380 domain-containing protein [Chloroflexota bacterium]
MKTFRFMDLDCIELDNGFVRLVVAVSIGPRILSLQLPGGKNLLAELPGMVTETPRSGTYRFFGGHRLWIGPEDIDRTYFPDDRPVQVALESNGVTLTQPADPRYGIEKTMQLRLAADAARVQIDHTITHRGSQPLEGAAWAITMLRPGGVAILPQNMNNTGVLSNRRLTLWPYTDIRSPYIRWGNREILVDCRMTAGRLKIGFPNPRGWLGCWLDGTLFVKRTVYTPAAVYPDFGASSQCYCCEHFLELETLGPVTCLADGESMTHTETWDVYPMPGMPFEPDEDFIEGMLKGLHLD